MGLNLESFYFLGSSNLLSDKRPCQRNACVPPWGSEGYFKWGGRGSLKGFLQKHLKTGVGIGKSCSQGGCGFEGVTTPAPQKILIIHYGSFLTDNSAQATKIFIVSSNIGVHQILCNNTDTEAKGYLSV